MSLAAKLALAVPTLAIAYWLGGWEVASAVAVGIVVGVALRPKGSE